MEGTERTIIIKFREFEEEVYSRTKSSDDMLLVSLAHF